MKNVSIKIVQNHSLNHNAIYKNDIKTKIIEIRSFLLYLSQNFQVNTFTMYGNFIAAKTKAISESDRLFSNEIIGINR